MSERATIQYLKTILSPSQRNERDVWKTSALSEGIAKGIIAEVCGNAKVDWLLKVFSEHQDTHILWCHSKSYVLLPLAIQQRGVELERILFVKVGDDLEKVLLRALESKSYHFMVAPSNFKETRKLQRLQLLSSKSQGTLFLIGENDFTQAWPISLQVFADFDGEQISTHVHRLKYGTFL